LAVLASLLIIAFGAREHRMLPLYAVGVFLSFTLSQAGMVIHWLKEQDKPGFEPTFGWRLRMFLNAFGAVCTFIVLVILLVTKFAEGAWLVAVAIPLLVWMFVAIHRHYEIVARSLSLDGITPYPLSTRAVSAHSNVPVTVLLNSLNRASLQALEYAIRLSDDVRAVTIEAEPQTTWRLKER